MRPHDTVFITALTANALSASHIRPVKAIHIVLLGTPVLAANLATCLLRRSNLGLQRRGVRIDPLQLCEMAVENAYDLTQLEGVLVYMYIYVKMCKERGKRCRKRTGSSGLLPLLTVPEMSLISLIILVKSRAISSRRSVVFSASLYVRSRS